MELSYLSMIVGRFNPQAGSEVFAPSPSAPRRVGKVALAGLLLASLACLSPSGANAQAPAKPEPLAVEITNTSEPVLCAEKDNVTLNLSSVEARRFRIEAAHPSYIGTIQRDSFEADWTGCTARR